MSDRHYDGDRPDEPLPPEHFTREQQEEARQLGDGSPAVDPRRGDAEPGEARPVREVRPA